MIWTRTALATTAGATLALILAAGAPTVASAQTTNDPQAASASDGTQSLPRRIEQLELELADLNRRLALAEARAERSADQAAPELAAATTTTWLPPAPNPSGRRVLADAPERSVHLAGYADVGMAISDGEGETGTTFTSGTFNPALYVQYRNFLLFESELEIATDQDGGTEFELEFAQFDLLLHDNVTLVIGKYLSPVGQYQERLHPSWISRLADAPAGFGHGGVQPTAEVGVQVRGGVPLGDARITYALAVGNGPRLDDGEVMSEGFGGDDNRDKAISGRFGFLPLPYLEFGASMLRAKVRGMDAAGGGPPATDVDYALWGADAAYTRGPWDVRSEYLRGERDPVTAGMDILPRLTMTAWYAQIAYQLSGLTQNPVLGNFEPVVRYGEYRVSGLEELEMEAAERRWDFGLNYWLAPSMVLHSAVQRRDFTGRPEGERDKDTRILLKFAYGF